MNSSNSNDSTRKYEGCSESRKCVYWVTIWGSNVSKPTVGDGIFFFFWFVGSSGVEKMLLLWLMSMRDRGRVSMSSVILFLVHCSRKTLLERPDHQCHDARSLAAPNSFFYFQTCILLLLHYLFLYLLFLSFSSFLMEIM